jgi:hypothetical protein
LRDQLAVVLWRANQRVAGADRDTALGDALVGIAAPFVALLASSRTALGRRLIVLWCVFGIADLVVAVTLGVLNSQTSFGRLAGEVTTTPLSVVPLSLIPTYLVPLSVILHLIVLRRIVGAGEGAPASLGASHAPAAG